GRPYDCYSAELHEATAHGNTGAGSPVCRPLVAARSRLLFRHSSDPGARYWRDYGDLQRRERGAARAAAVPALRPNRPVISGRQGWQAHECIRAELRRLAVADARIRLNGRVARPRTVECHGHLGAETG